MADTLTEMAVQEAPATDPRLRPLSLASHLAAAFPVAAGYLTTLGPVPVVLRRTGEQAYELVPRSSYADFLGRWLLDATAEFRGPEIP